MRIATLILGLVLSFVSFIQSIAVAAGGSISSDLSETAAEKTEADNLSSGGSVGVFASLIMLVATALVIAKPKASMYAFVVAAPFWLMAGGLGFSDGYVWAAVSAVLAVMSWAGVKERAKNEEKRSQRYQADLLAAAQALQSQQTDSGAPAGQETDSGAPAGRESETV